MESKLTLHFLCLLIIHTLNFQLFAQGGFETDCQELIVNAEIVPACKSGNTGKIILNIEKGLPPYQVAWEDGSNTKERSVPAGKYAVEVKDAMGCISNATFEVTEFSPIQVSVQVKHTTKSGKKNGVVSLSTFGGTPPYHYSWISGSTSDLNELSPNTSELKKAGAGDYKIVVFDKAGCYTEVHTQVN